MKQNTLSLIFVILNAEISQSWEGQKEAIKIIQIGFVNSAINSYRLLCLKVLYALAVVHVLE
jgi:hypothetical protein